MNILSILITLLIFSVLVVVHEFGHFIVARRNGILVEEFAIGMGPLIFGKEKNGTLYSLRLLPIGGYCKMLGEIEEDGYDERAFSSKTVFQRICVCLAGVVMNFLLAIVLATIVSGLTGITTLEINTVEENSPASLAGLMPGDKILKVDNQNTYTYGYLSYFQARNGGKEVEVKYERGNEKLTTVLTPKEYVNEDGSIRHIYGITLNGKSGIFDKRHDGIEKANILETLYSGTYNAGFYVKIVFDSLLDMVRMNVKLDDLAGPIGVGQVVSESIESSKQYGIKNTILMLLDLATLLSANLAILNLLPIPALDGGRIVFLIIEGIRKKPMDPSKEGMVQLISFAVVIIFAIVVAYNDVLRLFTK